MRTAFVVLAWLTYCLAVVSYILDRDDVPAVYGMSMATFFLVWSRNFPRRPPTERTP